MVYFSFYCSRFKPIFAIDFSPRVQQISATMHSSILPVKRKTKCCFCLHRKDRTIGSVDAMVPAAYRKHLDGSDTQQKPSYQHPSTIVVDECRRDGSWKL